MFPIFYIKRENQNKLYNINGIICGRIETSFKFKNLYGQIDECYQIYNSMNETYIINVFRNKSRQQKIVTTKVMQKTIDALFNRKNILDKLN